MRLIRCFLAFINCHLLTIPLLIGIIGWTILAPLQLCSNLLDLLTVTQSMIPSLSILSITKTLQQIGAD